MNAAHIRIASIDARVGGAPSLVAMFDRLHARLERASALEGFELDAIASDGELLVARAGRSQRRVALSPNAKLAALQVSRSIVDALTDVREPLAVARGTTLEREGRVHAIVSNEDGVGKTTLAFHLLSRGWRIVSDDRILIDRSSLEALPYRRLLTIGSSAIPFVPRMFRRALEASPWYYAPDAADVVYVAVDPALVCGNGAWSAGGRLYSVLFAMRALDGAARVEPMSGAAGLGERVLELAPLRTTLRFAALHVGAPTSTADAVEGWDSQS